jgi:glycosyltransferase involved in cell wall biosynthesis
MATIIFKKEYRTDTPEYSICMPIYNQEDIIKNVLDGLINNTCGTYEITLVLDACSDNTQQNVMSWVNSLCYNENLFCITIFKSNKPLFETRADNICFKNSRGKYLLEIQADMIMTQPNYNFHMKKPFDIVENVIGVSGRLGYNWSTNEGVGKLGASLNKPLEDGCDVNVFHVCESVARGPLLINAEKAKCMGYLDEDKYWLDGDDHDFFARAYYNHGFICGYVPIEFVSDLSWGNTRKARDDVNTTAYNQLKQDKPNHLLFLEEFYKNNPPRPIYEIALK